MKRILHKNMSLELIHKYPKTGSKPKKCKFNQLKNN